MPKLMLRAACAMTLIYTGSAAAQEVKGIEPNRGGEIDMSSQDPKVARERLFPAEGYDVNLFASEKEFPLGNPVAMSFDAKGRLWVCTMPSYPQRLPDDDPDDKIIILEDTDGDGRADKHTVFLDGLHVPTGFELGDGGAYIAQQPDLIFAKDTDGDDKADVRETILHGFGTEDSHHSISAFTWGPDGGLYFQEGTFHHSQVETPYGPVRLVDAGLFRYVPQQWFLEVFVTYGFANPWGHVFDRWGQNFIADASGGSNYVGAAMSGWKPYPRKSGNMKVFTSVVRPTAGCEIVSSRHFPDEAQGNFLINNCIGFQGIKQHRILDEGSGFTSEEVEPLLYSSDINFRPVDIEFGPDGALYIVDWFNPLIGHMQYSLRDEGRDHSHGRIWRITAKDRPLLTPPAIAGQPIEALLELLKTYEDRVRYRTRMELRTRNLDEVEAALKAWVDALDPADPEHEHHLLEALWTHQTISRVNIPLLDRVLASPDARARAAAVRVARHWRNEMDGTLDRLAKAVEDPEPRPRMEAVVALSYLQTEEAAAAALAALEHPTDYYLDYVIKETTDALQEVWKPAVVAGRIPMEPGDKHAEYLATRMSSAELLDMPANRVALEALVRRSDLNAEQRAQALENYAALDQKSFMDTWFAAIERIASGGGDRAVLLEETARVLFKRDAAELAPHRDALAAYAVRDDLPPALRQAALVGVMRGEGSVDSAWAMAQQDASLRLSLVQAVPDIPEPALRDALYEPLQQVLRDSDAVAAGEALPASVRYIRIELPGDKRVLTVAEVEVFAARENVATGAKVRQSSTAHGGEAARAVDGNRAPEFSGNGQTHTNEEKDPWLEIDLGEAKSVDRVRVWNRNDDDTGKRLDGFRIVALDESRVAVFTQEGIPAPERSAMIDIAADPGRMFKDAALAALAHVDAGGKDTFGQLVDYAKTDTGWRAAIESLARLNPSRWDAARFEELGGVIVARAEAAEREDLSTPVFRSAFAVGERLAALMPKEQAAALNKRLGTRVVQVRLVRPVPHQMIYDTKEILVKAGAPVEIVFDNTDIMPHNLVITAPDRMEAVGRLADSESLRPEAAARDYIPVTPDILHATKLVQPGQRDVIQFTAPTEPGDYPFVCTYPGHWLLMNGVMHVVEELPEGVSMSGQMAESADGAPQRPFVKLWKTYELTPALHVVETGRSFDKGKALFEAASCARCHGMDGAGNTLGPDLKDAGVRYSARDLLRHILEPDAIIHEDYVSERITTKDGATYVGHVFERSENEIALRQNLLAPDLITRLPASDVASAEPLPQSLMPRGLLVTFHQDEIYDLLAYILSGGDENAPAFADTSVAAAKPRTAGHRH